MKIRGFSVEEWISFPKSFIINWKLFGMKEAFLCPVFIANSVKCKGIKKGSIVVEAGDKYRGMINIGFGGSLGICANRTGYFIIGDTGRVVFKGTAGLAHGSSLRVDNGDLIFGNSFSCNKNCFISCSEGIEFGDDVLLGWNVNVRDSDGHKVYHDSELKPSLKPIRIGKHVWIASEVDILKGAEVSDGCIIGYRSCVTNRFEEANCLIAGYPAKVIQHNTTWEK